MDHKIVLDSLEYDYLVLGTGLTDSLYSASLSKKGKKVLVLDLDRCYSSSLQTVNLKELISIFTSKNAPKETKFLRKSCIFREFWIEESVFSVADFQANPNAYEYKYYNIDLQPKLLFSSSLTVDLMKEADMDRYMEFRAVKEIFHFDNSSNKFLITPNSKGQIFTHKDLSLLEKRTLFKTLHSFITLFHSKHGIEIDPNSTAEFDKNVEIENEFFVNYDLHKTDNCLLFLEKLKLQPKVQDILLYTLANCEINLKESQQTITTEELFVRMFKFVKSLGIHTSLPYLYSIYGTGDIPQAYARIAAVYGAAYIINEGIQIGKIKKEGDKFQVYSDIAGESRFFTCGNIIAGMEYERSLKELMGYEDKLDNKKKRTLLRVTLIIKGEFKNNDEEEENEENLSFIRKLPLIYIIPPKNPILNNFNPASIMIFGPNTCSCPKNHFLVNMQCVVEEEKVNFQEIAQKTRDLLYQKVKKEEDNWDIIFSGCFLQDLMGEKEVLENINGIILLKNNDFHIELDEHFKEFARNIQLLIPEFKDQNRGFFINKNSQEGNKDEEDCSQGGEIDKLLQKLDNLVLNKKENDEKSEPKNDEKEENSEKKEL